MQNVPKGIALLDIKNKAEERGLDGVRGLGARAVLPHGNPRGPGQPSAAPQGSASTAAKG